MEVFIIGDGDAGFPHVGGHGGAGGGSGDSWDSEN